MARRPGMAGIRSGGPLRRTLAPRGPDQEQPTRPRNRPITPTPDLTPDPGPDLTPGPDPRGPWTPEVYGELSRLAESAMAGERSSHTLEPAALAHEVWLRLTRSRNAASLDRGAFLGLAAQAMRRVLTDHARRRNSSKRGGDLRRTTLDGKPFATEPEDLALDLHAALEELQGIDPQLARIVELRFFLGCDLEDAAAALGVSTRTAKRRWRFARAWLREHLAGDSSW